MNTDFLDQLRKFDIPTCLRVCAGTDGSVTFLLEIMTRHDVTVVTEDQHQVPADDSMASLFDIDVGDDVNCRIVTLVADGVPYVYAKSLAPIDRMPETVRQDMMRADIPIGKILREHDIETRRDFDIIEMVKGASLFGCESVLSRSYRIVHNGDVLMWINEQMPVDDRWDL
ncbi:MAG: chorismate pyruvate-lyase family protein [Methanosarcinaceae archaeon]|nr:chorismate pyruvate-lyase family protein [Methanosarcinaceae archaeon]MDF1533691.1 chorismate pyruvate-lyase family protein [Methanosarcinaceae archaeon]